MKFRRIETPGISHYAYLIGDGGEAAIVDPSRDVDVYLQAARTAGLRITDVIETHRQEDFVMGAAHLAERTGARIVNGAHELFGHGDVRLEDGDTFRVGRLSLRALHTPGHTPESMSYAVYPAEHPDRAWGVFTGDALFFGDTGRTDLPDPDRSVENAGLLFDMVHEKIEPLGDQTLVFPAHGPGSVCGTGMALRPLSTIGAEKRYNSVFKSSRSSFAETKGGERIPRPPYFRHMEQVNLRGGLPPVRSLDVPLLSTDAMAERAEGGATLIDARGPEAFAGGHAPGAYAIWMGGLPVFGGWIASHDTPIVLVLDDDDQVTEAAEHLARIGIDGVQGALAGGFGSWRGAGRPIETSGIITPRELFENPELQVLDVRDEDEYAGGHIEGSKHTYVGDLERRIGDLGLDRNRPVAVTCSIGNRSGLGVSILRRAGFSDVRNVLGGMTAWRRLELPTRDGGQP